MSAPKAPIDFYFDFVSPYGYFASLRIEELAERHGRELRWHPILVGVTVLKIMGLKSVLETPLKGPYAEREIARYCKFFKIKLNRSPSIPPVNSIASSRAMAWLLEQYPTVAVPFAKLAYDAYWQQGLDLNDGQTVADLALEAGLPIKRIDSLSSDAAALALRERMKQAIANGVFGSPFVIVDDEPFFGVDKFELIDRWLTLPSTNTD